MTGFLRIIAFITIVSSLFNPAYAQIAEPVNSNYLIENGISPRVLDAAASFFLQDGKYSSKLLINLDQNGIKKQYHFDVIYDPEYKEGMDIRIISHNKDFSKKDKKEISNFIESNHFLSRKSRDYLYDESSLKVLRNSGDTLVLSYTYQKTDLEPYLRKIKHLKGEIYIVNGILHKIVLTNTKPIKKHITGYKKVVYYDKTPVGGYIVSHFTERYDIKKGKKEIKEELISNTRDYSIKDKDGFIWQNTALINEVDPGIHDTLNVKLGGTLPFLGKSATKLGYQLPRPVGVAGFTYFHDQVMDFTGLGVGINNSEMVDLENVFALDDSEVVQSSTIYLAKADVWIFPFLNLMAIVGGGVNDLDGQLIINEELRDFINDLPGWLDLPHVPDYIPIKSSVTSEIYGGGATLAGGIGDFNVTLNYQLMFTRIVEVNTTNMVNVVTPMVGYMAPFGVNFMLGAQGQFYNTKISGYIDMEDFGGRPNRLNYQVDFEPIKWNAIVGLYKGFNKHWEMSIQGGFGQRTSLTAIFGYRF